MGNNQIALIDKISNLQVWQKGDERAPHKPLLILLTLAETIKKNQRLFLFSEIEEPLKNLLKKFGPIRQKHQPEYPFYRLKNDDFWEVVSEEPIRLNTGRGDASPGELKAKKAAGGFTQSIFDLLRNDKILVEKITQTILEKYFPKSFHNEILDEIGLSLSYSQSDFSEDQFNAELHKNMSNFNLATDYFQTNPYTLYEFFVKNLRFKIPEYQRSFAWGDEEFENLWSDITSTETDNFSGFLLKDESQQKPHFMGAIVSERLPGQEDFEMVIDGQQRLTTLTVLFALTRDHVENMKDVSQREKLKGVIFNMIQVLNPQKMGTFIGRIELNSENTFFTDNVLTPTNSAQRQAELQKVITPNLLQLRFINCIEFFSKKLNKHFGDPSAINYDHKVHRFCDTLTYLITLMHLSVRRKGQATKIFETLNTRGLDLSQADLIKNEIFSRVAVTDQAATMDYWNEMQKQLPERDRVATEFIRTFYVSSMGPVKEQDLYETVAEHLTYNPALDFAKTLKTESSNYAAINESATGSTKVDELLRELNNVLDVKLSHILLLSGAQVFGLKSPDFERLVKITRDFCFRFFTVSSTKSVAKLDGILGETARNLRTNKDLPKVLTALQSKSADSVFKDDFKTYQAKKSTIGFYILRQLEIHLSAGAGGVIPYDRSPRQHLEHIMPQTPTSIDWDHVMDDERYTNYLNRVGNLLILEANINSSIKNKGFSVKTGLVAGANENYKSSVLKLPHEVINHGVNDATSGLKIWDFSSIEKRQDELASIAVQTWSLKY